MGGCNSCNQSSVCLDELGCPEGVVPDFCIKRHDTRPPFKIKAFDCNEPMDLTDLVLEAYMWAKAKFKKPVLYSDVYFGFQDDIGFNQINQGDLIVVDQVRAPEQMLVVGFDEVNKLVQVQRGYHGTIARNYHRATDLKIFRILNSPAITEMDRQDISQVDGSVLTDVLVESRLVYEWQANDTCLPGCYYFEFKLIKMLEMPLMSYHGGLPSTPISFISYTSDQIGCGLGAGVEWIRRFPVGVEGFLIKIIDSPTNENLT
jgi:hypothetical protein